MKVLSAGIFGWFAPYKGKDGRVGLDDNWFWDVEKAHFINQVGKPKGLGNGCAAIDGEKSRCPTLQIRLDFSQRFLPVLFHRVANCYAQNCNLVCFPSDWDRTMLPTSLMTYIKAFRFL